MSKAVSQKGPAPKRSGGGNPTLIVGAMIGVLVAVAIAFSLSQMRQEAVVLTAAQNISAYSDLDERAFVEVKVPANSVDEELDLTPEALARLRANDQQIVARVPLLRGQRVPRAALGNSAGALTAVDPDTEKVVAVTSTQTGIVDGLVQPGSVVTLYGADSECASSESAPAETVEGEPAALPGIGSECVLAENIKVLGVGIGESSAANLRAGNGRNAGNAGTEGGVRVLLIVPEASVFRVISAGDVRMSLNPWVRFEADGKIVEIPREVAGSEKKEG